MGVLVKEVPTARKREDGWRNQMTSNGNPYCESLDTRTGTQRGLVEFQHHGTVDSSDRADDLTSAARGCLVRHRGRSQAAPTSPSGSLPCGFTYNHEEGGGGRGIVAAERVGEEREGGGVEGASQSQADVPWKAEWKAAEALEEGERKRRRWERDEEEGGF